MRSEAARKVQAGAHCLGIFSSAPADDRAEKIAGGRRKNEVHPREKHFRLYSMNIQGMCNKTEFLEVDCQELGVDIHTLSETWKRMTQQIVLPGFTCVAEFSRQRFIRGGVAIYVKDCYVEAVKSRPDIGEMSVEKHFEIAAINCKLAGRKYTILNIYRSNDPSLDINIFFNKLEEALHRVDYSQYTVVVSGDLNIDLKKNDPATRRLRNIVESYSLHFTTSGYTRVTKNTRSAIDYVIVDLESGQYEANILPVPYSDHDSILLVMGISKPDCPGETKTKIKVKKRIFDSTAVHSFLRDIECEDWRLLWEPGVEESLFDRFLNIFLVYFNKHFPLKALASCRSDVTCAGVWITKGIKVSSVKLKDLYKLKQAYPENRMLCEHYSKYKFIYGRVIAQAKRMAIVRKIHRTDNKERGLWKVTKQLTGKVVKQNKFEKIEIDGRVIRNEREIANAVNNYFRDVCNSIKTKVAVKKGDGGVCLNDKSFFLLPTDDAEVYAIIMSLKNSQSADVHDVPVSLVKRAAKSIAAPLSFVFNKMMSIGHFPDCLKVARVLPVFKKGLETDVGNYRPISVLPVFSKIYEKIIQRQLLSFLNKTSQIPKTQHGFRPGHGTATAAFQLTDDVLQCLERGEEVLGMFFDLSKAFDMVCHTMLIDKLENCGVRGHALELFRSYLSNRKQFVEIAGSAGRVRSEILTCRPFSVPQGSILGPTLFIVYMGDLPGVSGTGPSRVVSYADDTTALVSGSDMAKIQSLAQDTVRDLMNWLSLNNLVLNEKKTILLRFAGARVDSQVSVGVNGARVLESGVVNFLGISLDSGLNWHSHVENLEGRLSSVCHVLRVVSRYVDVGMARRVYFGIFHSKMTYCVELWGRACGMESVLRSQKKAIRIITRSKPRDHCREKFKELKIMTVICVYLYRVLLFVSDNYHTLYTRNSTMHPYNTRHENDLQPIRHRTSRFERGLLYSGITIFNKLPKDIKTLVGTKTFTTTLRKFLVERPFYSVAEYLQQS